MSTQSLKAIARGDQPERQKNPIVAFSRFLDNMKPQIALALPKHLNADRMCRLALTAFSSSPALQECTPQSIAASIITASQLGLEPGVLGQGYLIPYKRTCTFVPGWQGLMDLLARSGRATAWTGAVFEGDQFEWQLGDTPFVRHVPMGEDDPNLMTHAYAVGRAKDAQFPVIEVWPMKKVWKHRDRFNKVGGSHYSYAHPEMYARKIALLQVIKYLPKSIELSIAVQADNDAEGMTIDQDFAPVSTDDHGHRDGSTIDTDTGEIRKDGGDRPSVSYAQIADRINKSESVDELDSHAQLIETFDLQQGKELRGIYLARRKALEGGAQ